MNQRMLRLYRSFRAKGLTGSFALSATRAFIAWDDAGGDDLEDDDGEKLVRLRAEPEWEPYDDDYSGMRPSDRKKAEEANKRAIDRDGLWVYISEARLSPSHPWHPADSLGMVIGELDIDYKLDLMLGALGLLDALRTEAAEVLSQRATFAGVST